MVNKVKEVLRQQKDIKMKNSFYHISQIKFAYNSNHMEGSKLSEEQTELIFKTNTVLPTSENEVINVDDLIETRNHFTLFDYLLDHADETLTAEQVKTFHKILKSNTQDAQRDWFRVGEWKKLPNVIGTDTETVAPENVEKEIQNLLKMYDKKTDKTFEDIIDFHVKFERIHPFQDGNGRVGRAIMFKECLKNNVFPFIVLDERKAFYYRGLKEYDREPGYILETCRYFQDIYKETFDKMIGKYLDDNSSKEVEFSKDEREL